MRIATAVFLSVLCPTWLAAQQLSVGLVDREVYPRIKVYTLVTDLAGEPICDLSKSDFQLLEADQPRPFRFISGKATETSVGILLDESGSMDDVIPQVREAARRFIDVMAGSDRAATYSFASATHHLHSIVDVAVGRNKEALKASLDDYGQWGGGTNLYTAIRQLVDDQLIKEADRRKAIVALTDGDSADDVRIAIEAAERSRTAIYAIGMGRANWNALERLTNSTGGQFYSLSANPSQEELDEIYREIRHRLECQYTLIYETPDICPDGTEIPVTVKVPRLEVEGDGGYKRPRNYAQMNFNLRFSPERKVVADPPDPLECEEVFFKAWLEASSCSDEHELGNVVVRANDVTQPGNPIEVAKSEPIRVRSNAEPTSAVVEWNTRGYLGDRTIELVIDPVDDILERKEEDNLQRVQVRVGEQVHDLYIESIEYKPKPAFPCDVIELTVNVNDGSSCKGTELHDIEIGAWDGNQSLGRAITSVTVGEPAGVSFNWEPSGFSGFRALKFVVDPEKRFGREQTLKNNTKEALVEVSGVMPDLRIVEIQHQPPSPIVGDQVEFEVRVADNGQCPGIELGEKIRVRASDAKSRRSLGQSEPFTMRTEDETLVPVVWETKRNDDGDREVQVTVDPEGKIREQTPPGKDNNSMSYELTVAPMPHDLVITSAAIQPETPRDGDPATVTVEIEDHARFDGVVLKGVRVRIRERYRGFMVGESEDVTIISQDKTTIEVKIDTGGLAGEPELVVVIDPDNAIEELTPEGLDGENNNNFCMRPRILE